MKFTYVYLVLIKVKVYLPVLQAEGCGHGTQTRNVSCLRHDDVIVANSFCSVAALTQIAVSTL